MKRIDQLIVEIMNKKPDWSKSDAASFILNRTPRGPEFDYLQEIVTASKAQAIAEDLFVYGEGVHDQKAGLLIQDLAKELSDGSLQSMETVLKCLLMASDFVSSKKESAELFSFAKRIEKLL